MRGGKRRLPVSPADHDVQIIGSQRRKERGRQAGRPTTARLRGRGMEERAVADSYLTIAPITAA
jgi:hypothetical protein